VAYEEIFMKTSKFQLILGLALAFAAITFGPAVRAQAQSVTFLHAFTGDETASSLIQGTDGNFYGVLNVGEVFRMTPNGELRRSKISAVPTIAFYPKLRAWESTETFTEWQ
jgi:hypothetical protein